jgi:hypothetical protein
MRARFACQFWVATGLEILQRVGWCLSKPVPAKNILSVVSGGDGLSLRGGSGSRCLANASFFAVAFDRMSKVFPQASASEHAEAANRVDAAAALPAKGHIAPSGSAARVPLSALHERKVAVHCSILGREETVVGRGIYERDSELGPVLRIDVPGEEHLQFTLAERSWDGEVVASVGREWDFLIRLFS